MLLLALGAVVVGFAFLVVSLLSQDAAWAWGCIAACVVGAGFVVADAVRRRQRIVSGDPEPDAAPHDQPQALPAQVGEAAPEGAGDETPTAAGPGVQAPVAPATVGLHRVDPPETATDPVADTGPAQEQAEPDAALVVAGLAQEVVVVDEHPRFHLAGCTWLDGRTTMALPVGEAVELGFTPCAWCTPVARLAAGSPRPVTG